MKKILYAIILLAPIFMVSCNDDDDVTIVTSPTATGTVTDDEGNVYDWVRVGNLDWTTSNALNGLSCTDYEFYNNFYWEYAVKDDDVDYFLDEFIPKYGNMMSYEEAKNSAPDGWRLPTDEDWKNLERSLGMTDADNMGWRGSNGVGVRLMESNGVGFGALLAGGGMYRKDGTTAYMKMSIENTGEYAYFWTATEDPSYEDAQVAYFRKLVTGVPGVERQRAYAVSLMSVRWCRNATND